MKGMKRLIVVSMFVLASLALVVPAFATNGYQIIGIGQNQKSMGGAVTAAPMDAMTAITNPAGMARVGSRADFSMEAFMPVRSVDFDEMGGDDETGGTEMYGIPAIGWTAPAFDREDVYFGGGMYGTAGLGVDYGEVLMSPGAGLDAMLGMYGTSCVDQSGPVSCSDVSFDGHSAIQFWKMAPTVAWNINDQASVGFSLNMDYQSVAITQRFNNVPFWVDSTTGQLDPLCDSPATWHANCAVGQASINFDIGRPSSQMGYGFTVGALYDPIDMVTLGLMYSSKQNFDPAEFRVGSGDIYNYNGALGKAGTYTMDLDFPQQLALGVAVRPIDQLLIAFDYKWIDWSSTHDEVKFTGPGKSFDSDGDGVGDKSSTELAFGWEDQTVYALGIAYAVNEKLDVRAGYNYAKAPIDEEDVFNNLVFPATVERHVALGFDYDLGAHWGLGMTYMKAYTNALKGEKDVPKEMQPITPFGEDSEVEISLEETSLGMQLSYRF